MELLCYNGYVYKKKLDFKEIRGIAGSMGVSLRWYCNEYAIPFQMRPKH